MKRIKKTEFIEQLAVRLNIVHSEAERFVHGYNDLVVELVSKDRRVFTGLGQFMRSKRKARLGINPRTLKRMEISALITAKFKASETFKQAIK